MSNIQNQANSFAREQATIKQQRKLEEKKKAAMSGMVGNVLVMFSILAIIGSAWWTYDRLQPPGFVRMSDIKEKVDNGAMTVSGRAKNMTRKDIAEKVYVISYVGNDKKNVTTANLVLKDLKVGETRTWALPVPGWKSGTHMVLKRKEE